MFFKQYPMLRVLLVFISGILLSSFIGWYSIIGLVLSFLVFFRVRFAIWFTWLFFGACLAYLEKPELINLDKVEAYTININKLPEDKPKTYKCEVEISAIKQNGEWSPSQGKTLLYFNKEMETVPVFGNSYLIRKAAREIEGPKNPGEFHYKNYLARNGIFFHQFLREGDIISLGKSNAIHIVMQVSSKLRLYSERVFAEYFEGNELGVAKAMLLGLKSDLDHELRGTYAAAGAVHILAVSGLHVGIILLLFEFLFRPLRKSPWLYSLIILVSLWMYALFTGLSPSVSRATLMFTLLHLGLQLGRDKNKLNVLFTSALLLLFMEPSWIYDVGFQLSYLAMIGILSIYDPLQKLWQPKNKWLLKLWQLSVVSVAAQLFTFPLSIYYFHQFPNYFLITNPIVTVLSTFILYFGIVFLFLAKVPLIGMGLGKVLGVLLLALNHAVEVISNWPYSKWDGLNTSLWETISLYILLGCILLFLLRKNPLYLKGSVVVLIVIIFLGLNKHFRAVNHQELIFHYIPKSSGISVLSNAKATFYTDKETANDPRIFDFHLRNYYNKMGVSKHQFLAVKGNTKIAMNNMEILWLRDKVSYVPENFNYVLVSNNAVRSLDRTFEKYPELLILDDTNSFYTAKKLKEEAAALGINLISLYDTGAKQITF